MSRVKVYFCVSRPKAQKLAIYPKADGRPQTPPRENQQTDRLCKKLHLSNYRQNIVPT